MSENEFNPTEQAVPVEMFLDDDWPFEPMTWQQTEKIQAGDVIRIRCLDGRVYIFESENPLATAVAADGRVTGFDQEGYPIAGEINQNARITTAHPASELRARPFIELCLLYPDRRTAFALYFDVAERLFVPELQAFAEHNAWRDKAQEYLEKDATVEVLYAAAQYLQERAVRQPDSPESQRFIAAASVITEHLIREEGEQTQA